MSDQIKQIVRDFETELLSGMRNGAD